MSREVSSDGRTKRSREQQNRRSPAGRSRTSITSRAFLWAILAPVFPDIDDEENLPSIGHANPRADLAVPSLRTLIEVKYIRKPGQAGFKAVMDEIASDTGLYLSKSNDFDVIIAVVRDDCAQTEQHYELKSGIEQLNGVMAAIIFSRPSRMKRKKAAN